MNKMEESKEMKELHAIRERHYEEIKSMDRAGYIKSIKNRAACSNLKVMKNKKTTA